MDTKPICKYDPNCYRKNPDHIKNFSHPSRDQQQKQQVTNTNNNNPPQQQPPAIALINSPPKPKTFGEKLALDRKLKEQALLAQQEQQQQQQPPASPAPKQQNQNPPFHLQQHQQQKPPSHQPLRSGGTADGAVKKKSADFNSLMMNAKKNSNSAVASASPGRRSASATNQQHGGYSHIEKPEPRESPLKNCHDPSKVFEMPFPLDDMKAVLELAKNHIAFSITATPKSADGNPKEGQQPQQNTNPLRAFPGIILCGPFDILHSGANFDSDVQKWMFHRKPLHPPEAQTFAYIEPDLFQRAFGIATTAPKIQLLQQQTQHHEQQRRDRDDDNQQNSSSSSSSAVFRHWPTLCFFRDDPTELPFCVASYGPGGRELKPILGSFAKVLCYVLRYYLPTSNSAPAELINNAPARKPADVQLVRALYVQVFKGNPESAGNLGREISSFEKERQRKCISKTFSGIGMVCPYQKDTELGYREPHLKPNVLSALLLKMNIGTGTPKDRNELDEQLRWADIANDECDFGMGLEIGLNFFYSSKLDPSESRILNGYVFSNAIRMLDICYSLLGRDVFRHIVTVQAYTYRSAK
jgi:hypothetical protein